MVGTGLMGMDVVVAFLVEWAAKRVSGRIVERADYAVDAAVDRMWTIIAGKLGGHPAVVRFRETALQVGQIPSHVRDEAEQVLRSAAVTDQRFAQDLQEAVRNAMALRAQGVQPVSFVDNKQGNHVGDVVAGGPVKINQRVVNYAAAHPARFIGLVAALLVVVILATYGGIRLVNGVNGSHSATSTPSDSASARAEAQASVKPQVAATFTVQGGPTSMAFSPDGQALAVGIYSSGGASPAAVTIHNSASGEVSATLKANGGTWVSFSPDGKSLAVSASQGTAGLWRTTGNQSAPAVRLLGDNNSAGAIASSFVPGSATVATLATGDTSCVVRFWDSVSGANTSTLSLKTEKCHSMTFAADGSSFATFGLTQVQLWDRSTGRNTVSFSADDYVTAAAFGPTSQFLATGNGRSVSLWQPHTGQNLGTLHGHTGDVRSVAFSPNGKTLATGSNDGTVRLWDLISRKEMAVLPGHDEDDDGATALAFSPDGQTLATAGGDGKVRLWRDIG
jgi:WD40 repeat protein